MKITKLDQDRSSEFRALLEIFNEVFDNDEPIPEEVYLKNLLSNEDFMVFVVKIGNQVVAGLTIYVLHGYQSKQATAYIYDVGVTPSFQGQGIGTALMANVCKYCKELGFKDAYVEADNDDSDAIRFYRKTNISSEVYANHFSYIFDGKKN